MFSLAPTHLWSPALRFSKMEERTARRWFLLTWESTFSTTVCFEISTPGELKSKAFLKYLPLLTCPPSKLSLKQRLQVSPFLANREAITTVSQSRENGLRHRGLQITKACFWPASFANTALGQGWKHAELSDHVGISVDQLQLVERIKALTACYLLLGWAASMHSTTQQDKPLGKAEKQLQPAHGQDLISQKLHKGSECWEMSQARQQHLGNDPLVSIINGVAVPRLRTGGQLRTVQHLATQICFVKCAGSTHTNRNACLYAQIPIYSYIKFSCFLVQVEK